MDTATIAGGMAGAAARSLAHVSYDVLLRASVPTRFRVRDRWIIAGSFADEGVARREYTSLAQEFPAETVHLRLVRCVPLREGEETRDQLLESREPAPPGQRRGHPPAAPSPAPARPRAAAPPRQPRPAPELAQTGGGGMLWQLALGGALAALLLGLLLR